ncbi:hypothetical protein [Nocardia sp. NPDC050710]|uniref:hypothetical protein n=1 Tax=Nocardia sp. NPDC050710 TaxID=3157220 RepID=UPI0033D5479B
MDQCPSVVRQLVAELGPDLSFLDDPPTVTVDTPIDAPDISSAHAFARMATPTSYELP